MPPKGYKMPRKTQASSVATSSQPISVPVVGAPDGALETQTSYFTNKQIEELQKNPQNRVYGYEYDQVDRVLPPIELESTLNEIRKAYEEIRSGSATAKDVDIRDYLLETNPQWKHLASHSHTKMFEYVTSMKCKMEYISFMCQLKQEEHQARMPEETRMRKFNDYFYEKLNTGMTVEEYEKKMKDEDDAEGVQTQFGVSTAPVE